MTIIGVYNAFAYVCKGCYRKVKMCAAKEGDELEEIKSEGSGDNVEAL